MYADLRGEISARVTSWSINGLMQDEPAELGGALEVESSEPITPTEQENTPVHAPAPLREWETDSDTELKVPTTCLRPEYFDAFLEEDIQILQVPENAFNTVKQSLALMRDKLRGKHLMPKAIDSVFRLQDYAKMLVARGLMENTAEQPEKENNPEESEANSGAMA